MRRQLSLEGVLNARELGGLVNAEGKTVRRGLLLRTANLSRATDADLARLKEEYRLARVIDLRTRTEREESPDRLPDGAAYLCEPIFDEATGGITREKDAPASFSIPDMPGLYRVMVSEASCRRALRNALTAIFTHPYEEGAILWHCTAGKDRCGVVSALVLGALSLERAEILRDYDRNDPAFFPMAEDLRRRVLAQGFPEAEAARARDAFLAIPAYLEAALRTIDERYAGLEEYLTEGLEIPLPLIRSFRAELLE